jgi:hypothetical protein
MSADVIDHVESLYEKLRAKDAEIARLRAFIESLDGKTIGIRGDGNTFTDDGIVVASDILDEQEKKP